MRICMIVPNPAVKGGIASVVNGYRGSGLERLYEISYVESYRDGSKWQKLCKALSGYCAFIRQLIVKKPDIVHIHSSFGPSFYRKIPFIYLSRLCGIPVVNHIHGADFHEFYEAASAAGKKRIARVYGRCARILVLSEEWKERIGRIVPPERIVVLENYCILPKEPCDRGRKAHQVLFLGEIGRRKGCCDIPAIWEEVVREIPDARLIMAGDGDIAQIREIFRARGLESRVAFTGWVRGQEKARLLRESAVFLLPSYHEGMPMSVLEAMGYRMGIVTTAVGGIPQLIRHGENGCIRQPGDVQGLASDIAGLLRDTQRRAAYGSAARADADRHYGLEQHIRKLCGVYEDVARAKAGDS